MLSASEGKVTGDAALGPEARLQRLRREAGKADRFTGNHLEKPTAWHRSLKPDDTSCKGNPDLRYPKKIIAIDKAINVATRLIEMRVIERIMF